MPLMDMLIISRKSRNGDIRLAVAICAISKCRRRGEVGDEHRMPVDAGAISVRRQRREFREIICLLRPR